jgi:hypothetical protein
MIAAVAFVSLIVSAWASALMPAAGHTTCARTALYLYNARVNAKYVGAGLGRPFSRGDRRIQRRPPPFWPEEMTLRDKLSRLGLLAPQKLEAIGVLVDRALRDSWPAQADDLGRGRRKAGRPSGRKQKDDRRQT